MADRMDAAPPPKLTRAQRSVAIRHAAREAAIRYIADVDAAALPALGRLLQDWWPAGRLHGHEFHIGSLDGEPGASLKVNVVTGLGKDFADGERGYRGAVSILQARLGISRLDAAKLIAAQLGLPTPAPISPLARARASGQAPAPARTVPAPQAPEQTGPAAAWEPILPVPSSAPRLIRDGEAWTAKIFNPRKVDAGAKAWKPSRAWTYRDAAGQVLGHVLRLDFADGSKVTPTVVWARHRETGAAAWVVAHFPALRPLYGLDRLAVAPEAAVLLVEGEKAADAGAELLQGRAVSMTWPGGAKAVGLADWSPLAGRRVIVSRDADEAGIDATRRILVQLERVGAEILVLEPPAGVSEGWDIADAGAEQKWRHGDAAAWLRSAISAAEWREVHPHDAGAPSR